MAVTMCIESPTIDEKALKAVQAVTRTFAQEMTQPLTVLMGEVDLALRYGRTLSNVDLHHMLCAILEIAGVLQTYQDIQHFEVLEEEGLPVFRLKALPTNCPA